MDYKMILVSLDSDEHASMRMRYAADLAQRHEAHLLGVAVAGGSELNPAFDADGDRLRPEDLLHGAQHRVRVFVRFMRGREQSHSVRIDNDLDGTVAERLARHGRQCDLFVLGQSSQQGPTLRLDDRFVSDVFTRSGRPALILPPASVPTSDISRVLVAWDGSREANRALGDALPVLQQAAFVMLLNVYQRHDAAMSPVLLNDVVAWLARHGVKATSARRAAAEGKAQTLRAAVEEECCNLLVMGGYGHHRVPELVFGGMTREVLGQLNFPVLVSH